MEKKKKKSSEDALLNIFAVGPLLTGRKTSRFVTFELDKTITSHDISFLTKTADTFTFYATFRDIFILYKIL